MNKFAPGKQLVLIVTYKYDFEYIPKFFIFYNALLLKMVKLQLSYILEHEVDKLKWRVSDKYFAFYFSKNYILTVKLYINVKSTVNITVTLYCIPDYSNNT